MRASTAFWSDLTRRRHHPSVGDWVSLCEENFERCLRLIPDLHRTAGVCVSSLPGSIDLYLSVEEQSRYTTLFRLTHCFPGAQRAAGVRSEPNARLRICYDARQLEVLELHQSLWVLKNEYQAPALADKWQANLFMAKWLSFCLRQGHCFGRHSSLFDSPAPSDRLPTCS